MNLGLLGYLVLDCQRGPLPVRRAIVIVAVILILLMAAAAMVLLVGCIV